MVGSKVNHNKIVSMIKLLNFMLIFFFVLTDKPYFEINHIYVVRVLASNISVLLNKIVLFMTEIYNIQVYNFRCLLFMFVFVLV